MALTKVKGSVWDAADNLPVYYVTDPAYGATGDGSTDDTTAIQAAIDAAETAGGGVVYFPVGVYIVTDTLLIDDENITLQGETAVVEQMFTTSVTPKGSVIKLDDAAFTSSSKPIVKFIYQGANSEARLGGMMNDLVVFGNRSTDTLDPTDANANNNNTYGIGVQIVGARYVTLRNVFCLWCAEDGFQTITGGSQSVSCNNLYFDRCVSVNNVDDGFDISAGDSHIIGLQAGFNGGDGIAAGGGIYLGCNVWDNFSNGMRLTGVDVSVVGGEYKDNQDAGILVSGTIDRFLISGIIAQDNGKDTGLTAQERSGIYVSGAANGAVSGCVLGNRDGSTQQYGLRLAATSNVTYSGLSEGGTANSTAFLSDLSTETELTIATGAVTISPSKEITYYTIDTESDAASDDLDTITGGTNGQLLIVQAANSGRTVVAKDGTGNLVLAGDFSLDSTDDKLLLVFRNSGWHELSRSDNG